MVAWLPRDSGSNTAHPLVDGFFDRGASMKRGRRNRQGFSLVEVIAAMAIITISLIALLALINSTTKLQLKTEKQAAATNAARNLMEIMKCYSVADIFNNYNGYSETGIAGFCGSDEAETRIAVQVVETDQGGAAKVVRATLTVRWKTGEREGQKVYDTMEMHQLMAD